MPTSLNALSAATRNRDAIFKAKDFLVFAAPKSTAIPTSFTTGTVPTLSEIPTAFKCMGLINKDDAVSRSRDRDVSDVMAVGYQSPVRSDTTMDTWSVQFAALEMNRYVLEQYHQMDLSAVAPDATTGEIQFIQSMDGLIPQYRWLFIGQDGVGTSLKWVGWMFSAGIVSETDDQTFGGDDDPVMFNMTVSSQVDTTLGWAVKNFMCGPGIKSQLTALGFVTTP